MYFFRICEFCWYSKEIITVQHVSASTVFLMGHCYGYTRSLLDTQDRYSDDTERRPMNVARVSILRDIIFPFHRTSLYSAPVQEKE
jgi:hypothetical protein